MTPDIVACDKDHCIAVWNHTLIHIWRGETTVFAVSKMIHTSERLLLNQRGVTCLAVVESSSPAPSDEVWRLLARWSSEVVPRMALAAFVTDGGGFRAAIVRGVGLTLTALMPHRVPFKFFSSVDEGAQYLGPELPPGTGGPMALVRTVEELRASMLEDEASNG